MKFYGLAVLLIAAGAIAEPAATITQADNGAGALLELGAGHYSETVAQFMAKVAHRPGVKITGKGRSLTVINGPLHFRGAYPELSDLTVTCSGDIVDFAAFEGPGGEMMRGCVVFENPITATTTNVTIRADIVGLRTLVHTITTAGAPDCDWKTKSSGGTWPMRHDGRARLWRDSKSEHRNIEVLTFGGGGILAFNNVSQTQAEQWRKNHCNGNAALGNFANHLRLIGGHIWDGTGWHWHRCRLGIDTDDDCAQWRKNLAPLPALDVRGYTVELIAHHMDVMPHLGIWLNDGSRLDITGQGSFIEPMVNWNKGPQWHISGAPGWIIGGADVSRPQWGSEVGRELSAGNFRATGWPGYVFGNEKGNALFEKTAVW